MANIIKKAFIFSAGRGTRFKPYSATMPKPLFPVDGISLIRRSFDQVNSSFSDLEKIYVLIRDSESDFIEALISSKGFPKCEFLIVPDRLINKGLVGGYAHIKDYVAEDELFLSVLGDEYYGGDDHSGFASFIKTSSNFSAVCGVKRHSYPDEYLKNYSVNMDNKNIINKIIEKPKSVNSDFFGLGILVAKGILCKFASQNIEKDQPKELFNILYEIKRKNSPIKGFEFKDTYVNINTPSDIYNCLRQIRKNKNPTVDVIIPAWNEAETISYVVKDFLPFSKSVIVMDNLSSDGTAEIARKCGARVYSEKLIGYGDAIKKGLDRAESDILVIVEADGTFRAKDLPKLLSYLNDSDAVIGSRTFWQYIEYGANMNFIQRAMNVLFGRFITLLWWNRKSRFTDVGCSYRVIWKSIYDSIKPSLKSSGPEFAPEVVIELLERWHRVIEVPIPYHSRNLGTSKFSGSYYHLSKTALKMFYLIISRRVKSWFKNLLVVIKEIIKNE